MRAFVEQHLIEEPVAHEVAPVAGVDEKAAVVPVPAEQPVARVHVDLLSPRQQHRGQAPESRCEDIHLGPGCRLAAEFRIDLKLDVAAVNADVEQVGVDGDPGINAPVEDDALAPSAVGHVL